MAIKVDMERAKQKLAEEKKKAQRFSDDRRPTYWRAKPGTNRIRILPPYIEEGPNSCLFWREVGVHYKITAKDDLEGTTFTVPCPKMSQDARYFLNIGDEDLISCPICDYIAELKESGHPDDIEQAKNKRAKTVNFTNIIDLNDPIWTEDAIEQLIADGCPENKLPTLGDPKVQVYSFGSTVLKGLLDHYNDNIDLTDLIDGHNVKIEREGTGINTKYRVSIEIRPSKAPIEDKQLDDLMYNLDSLLPYLTTHQMNLVLEGATKEDIYSLGTAQVPESKQLPAKEEKKNTSSVTEEPVEEEPSAEEEPAEEEPKQEVKKSPPKKRPPKKKEEAKEEAPPPGYLDPNNVPKDEDGYVDYDALTDEQLYNPDNAELTEVTCFGKEVEYKPESEDCAECMLNPRCGPFIEKLKQKESPKKSPPKRGRPPKKETKEEKEDLVATDADDLKAKMMAALKQKK